MKTTETQSLQIDRDIAAISRESLPGITKGLVELLAQHLDTYRIEVAKERHQLEQDLKSMTMSKDEWKASHEAIRLERNEWKADAAASEAKLDKALEELARKPKPVFELTPVEIQSGLDRVRWAELLIEQLPLTHDGRNSWLQNYARRAPDLNNGEPLYADMAAPGETDKSVFSWTCCTVRHSFTAPRGINWTHEAECHECGSKTTIMPS